jgi:hypothetical protein
MIRLWRQLAGSMIPVGHHGGARGVGPLAEIGGGCEASSTGSRDLVIGLADGRRVPLVEHVLDGNVDDRDLANLRRLQSALDDLAGRGRR